MRILFKTFAILLIVWAIKWGCDTQTDSFRLYEILSAMPNKARWETTPLNSEQREKLLSQPFFFLGHGEQFYAFLGSDQKTVLKFFRHDHLSPKHLVRFLPLPTSLKTSFLEHKSRYDLSPLFDSAKLAYDELKEETALIYLHLNKTEKIYDNVTIYDKLGIRHEVDLNATEFALQHYVEPFCQAIDRKMQQNEVAAAKEQIHSLICLIKKQCQNGITNTDSSFKRNFGALGNMAITLDMGSLLRDERVKDFVGQQAEIQRLTARLNRWLKKHHPELLLQTSPNEESLPKTTQNL